MKRQQPEREGWYTELWPCRKGMFRRLSRVIVPTNNKPEAFQNFLDHAEGETRSLRNERNPMSDKITLIVHFKLQEAVRTEFISRLKEVFVHIEQEETFVEASLQQDREDPTSLLVYEVWRETPESFMKNQMTREYRKGFERAIVRLEVERTPSWYTALIEWKRI